ncbi:MAG: T9SS type A sorting domain-containing protein [Bacteroidota bacterium]
MKKIYPVLLFTLAMTSAVSAATFTSSAVSGLWSNPGSWSVSGSDADGIPDGDDDVIIAPGTTMVVDIQITDFRSMDINAGGTLSALNRQMRNRGGNFTQNGTFTTTTTLYFFGLGGVISGNFTNSGNWYFYNNSTYTIPAGNVINKPSKSMTVLSNSIENNSGTVRLLGGSINTGSTSVWNNLSNSVLRVGRPFSGTVNIQASSVDNTVEYNGSLASPVANLPGGYYNLTLRVSNKTLNPSGTFLIAGDLSIIAVTAVNASSNNIILGGNWLNSGSANITNLPLITFNSTDNQTVQRTTGAEVFTNVDISSSASVQLLGDVIANGTTNLISGTLDLGTFNYRQRGVDWNGEGGFVSTTGRVIFEGTAAQNIGGSFFTDFGNLEINNTAGVNNVANNRIRGTLFLTAGTLTASSNDFLFVSDASGTARINQVASGGGTLGGTRFICQRFIGVSAPSTTTPYWSYFSSPVTGSTVLDWDNEMYMSGVGGADGNACCPIFRSVRRYSASVYTNVTSTGTALGTGQGFMVWTADNMTAFSGVLFDTRGVPVIGDQTIAVPSGFTIIGNPLMSQVQWSSFTRTNVNNFFYIIDESISNFATWDGSTNTGTAKLAGSGGVINSSQGFMVQATAAGSVGIAEAAKTNGTAVFVRQAADNAMLRLQLKRKDGQPIGAENLITFGDGYTSAQDAGDIPALVSPNENAPYMRTVAENGADLFFDNRNYYNETHSIPVIITPGMAGDFDLKFGNINQFSAYSCVVLEDLKTGEMIDVRNQESITLTAENGVDELRYMLHFDRGDESATGVSYCRQVISAPEATVANTIPVNAISTPDGMLLNFGYEETTPVVVTIYNTLGQELLREQLNVSSEQVKLPLEHTSHGIYILRIQQGEIEVSQKINY